ncbi:MAG TPA: hypothetical protein VM686_41605 [Polyangiaceae bacterium]|nr:hypothetical protein [Polyangiaceae bacterium]
MSLRALAPAPLIGVIIAFSGACGDRVGEPIVAAAPRLEGPAGTGGGAGGPPAVAGGGPAVPSVGGSAGGPSVDGEAGAAGTPGAPIVMTDPYGGLCTSCSTNDDCGDLSDHCLENQSGELFCARDCDEWYGCPVGYECVNIASGAEPQCVPQTQTCIHLDFKPPPPTPDALRVEAVDFINDLRAERGLFPLVQDDCLTLLAEESAIELAVSGDYFAKFERECLDVSECECGWYGQFEIATATYDLRYDDIFEQPILGSLAQDPNDFQGTLFSSEVTRIGYGMVLTGDEGFAAYSLGL